MRQSNRLLQSAARKPGPALQQVIQARGVEFKQPIRLRAVGLGLLDRIPRQDQRLEFRVPSGKTSASNLSASASGNGS